jgi:type I restriction enzyme S subunit
MTDTRRLVPKRRFREFIDDGAWEQRELGTWADRYDNLRVPITASVRVSGSTPYYGANGILDYVEGHTHDGEFILVAEDGANDLRNYPVQYVNGKIWVNNHAHVLQAKKEIADNKFLKSAISQTDIEPYLVGGGRAKLNADIMMRIYIMAPGNLEEQEQLGTLFQRLDNLITLQQRKLEKIKNLKSAYLSKMFPKEGEKYPVLRFAGFTDAWEQRELVELANFTKGSGYTRSDLRESGSPIILYGRLYTDYEIWVEDVNTFVDKKEKSVISLGGEVIVPSSGESAEDIVRASVVGKPGIILGGDLNVIKPTEQIDPVFLALAISNGTPNRDMAKRAQGKSVVHLHNSDLKKINLVFPQIEEQRNIVNFNLQIDNLIALHQRKLEKLKNIKQAYFNEMFV